MESIEWALNLLSRAPVWVETRRDDKFVWLEAVSRHGQWLHDAFPLSDLTELLKQNKVKCDTSQRIVDRPELRKPRDVAQSYWSVISSDITTG